MLYFNQLKGRHRCTKYNELKSRGIENSEPGVQALIASVVISAVKDVVHGKCTGLEAYMRLEKEIRKACKDVHVAAQTLNLLIEEAKFCLMRYTKDELRNSKECKHAYLPFGEEKVDGKADAIFINPIAKSVEFVVYAYTKPNITQKGKKQDGCVDSYLPLYILFCMAENMAKEMGCDDEWMIKSSVYFLKKANDKFTDIPSCDLDFFQLKNGKNIVTLASTISDTQKVHDMYTPQIEHFLDMNERMDESVCEFCEMYPICKWKPAPKPISKDLPAHGVSVFQLSEDQQKVVFFNNGIARVNAGAGSGKTTSIVLNVIKMIEEENADPYSILMLTFTNAAAKEMKERIKVYADAYKVGDTDGITVTTFHGFGNSLLQKEYKKYGYSAAPVLIDDVERASIIDTLLQTYTVPDVDYRNYAMNMPNCKGALAVTAYLLHAAKKFHFKDVEEAYKHIEQSNFYSDNSILYVVNTLLPAYNAVLLEKNLMEYEDQEAIVHQLLADDPKYLEKLGYEHIIVDEFQDTDEGEFELLKAFVHTECFVSLMVVGDDSQAIYGFRETTPEFMLKFWEKLEAPAYIPTWDFSLVDNHRSSKNILNLANNINRLCGTKLLETDNDAGTPVEAYAFDSRDEEVNYVTENISTLLTNGEDPENICIIAYKKSELARFAEALEEKSIGYQMINPELLFENSNIQAALYLPDFASSSLAKQMVFTALANATGAENTIDWRRAMTNMVENASTDKELCIALLRSFDPDGLDELFQNFLEILLEKEDVFTYLRSFKLFGENQAAKKVWRYGGITLTTAHSSKGLEWPVVYASLSGFDGKDIPDDCMRLLYVTVTRARSKLIVTGTRMPHGSKIPNRYLATVMTALGITEAE